MKNFTLLPIIAIFAFLASPLLAQNQPAPANEEDDGAQDGIAGFWEVITSDGRFVVRLDQIASVSQHQYLIDGGIRVYELTVDTTGVQTARFYYIESVNETSSVATGSATFNRIKDLANQATEKAGMGAVDSIVTKHYPDTTHAKTSEYRMSNKATINQIYDHVHRVWAEEKGRGKKNRLVIRNG
tara:strand:+ start:139 stop:693 length:555 start_codon:yes stop_codon:yes gene_type:complete